MRRVFFLAALLSAALSWGQGSTPNPLPEPYGAEEFPRWAVSLRRWEIVSLGVYPIALFYTRLVFDFDRYARSGFEPFYAPWPFKNEYSYSPTQAEHRSVYVTAALIAGGFGVLDAIMVHRKQNKAGN